MKFRSATANDHQLIADLLRSSDLPFEDIKNHLSHFVLAESDGMVTGCAGLEIYGNKALLRSVAVRQSLRKKGMGVALIRKILETARAENITDVYLLTTTASKFFQKFGFEDSDRSSAPDQIRNTSQFTSLCPSTAAFMHLHLA